jgi:hypothetical protein
MYKRRRNLGDRIVFICREEGIYDLFKSCLPYRRQVGERASFVDLSLYIALFARGLDLFYPHTS